MSLVREATIRLRAEGFDRAEAGARNIGSSLEQAQRRADALGHSSERLGRRLSALSAGLNLAAGATGSDTIGSVGRVVQATATGLRSGPWGAVALGGVQLAAEAYNAYQASQAPKTEINISVPLQDGDIRRTLAEANEALRIGLERRFADMNEGARRRGDMRGDLGR